MPYSILVVDDEALTLRTISRSLVEQGFEVSVATSGEDALRIFGEEKPDITLLDIVLPGVDGLEVLRALRRQEPGAVVIMMSAYHVVERAVESMKLGAYDYLVKPFHVADLVTTIERAAEMLALRVRVSESVQRARGTYDFGRIVTQSAAMAEMLRIARKAAEAERTTILIQGESGTGKEVLAKTIHYHSPRAQSPLLDLNCAALPDTLLESELFGYEPGAFTDARRRKEGLLERAHSGTLFLDEIGNMSLSMQAKLLRVLEEGTFTRLGGTRSLKADVRIIAATNRDMKKAVAEATFRDDLYYRLNVVPLFIPPLRERVEDILPLALDLMKQLNHELKKSFASFTPGAAELLMLYPWPGNIRELKNVVERTMILAPEPEIDAPYLPEELREYAAHPAEAEPALDPLAGGRHFAPLRAIEDRYIDEVLAATGNNKTAAARILGIHPTSLLRRLKQRQESAERSRAKCSDP
jgi:two-component system response regulator AtoC